MVLPSSSPQPRIQGSGRASNYYCQGRPEVADLVPPDCRRVLEIGCGSGELGALLRQRGHHVTGIELIPEVAEKARLLLDEVICADIESIDLSAAFESTVLPFDAIVLADILEHLVDPWTVLSRLVALLTPGGRVVASIPNVQNFDVIWRLIRGRWDYRERGILDIGHLRFFTLRSIHTLFERAGLVIDSVGHRYHRTWWRELLCALSAGRGRPFFTRQYLVVGRRAA